MRGTAHVFELVDGTGSQDNGRFVITGNQLIVKDPIDRDFEAGFQRVQHPGAGDGRFVEFVMRP